MPRAVLFDLDGTLLDTLDDLAGSMNLVLAAAGLPEHPRDAYRRFVGDGIEVLVRRVLPAGPVDDERVRGFVAELRRIYAERWPLHTRPYPGIPELLGELAARGLPLAVLSNKPHDFVCVMVRELLDGARFEAVLGVRPGTPKKPDPTVALEVATRLGLPPGEMLFVGDTPIDMRTARAAGMTPVGVLWGFRGAAELEAAGARHLIARPGELLPLL